METFELNPVNGRKSFYGKCKVTTNGDGIFNLISYSTNVARYDRNTRTMQVFGQYSNTTCTHIRAFLGYFGFDYDKPISKILAEYPRVEEEQPESKGMDVTKFAAMFSAMAGLCAGDDLKAQNAARADIYKRTPGIHFPDNWDSLPEEEKKERLDKVQAVGLGD